MNDDTKPKNKFKVPKRQWKRWTVVGKHVFNKTFEFLTENQDKNVHPEADLVPAEYFRTTAWNAAFTAAGVASRGEQHLLDILTKEVKGHGD